MAMTKRLWSINGLATELGRDRRTIAGALAATPPDGRIGRHDAWHLATAIAALQPAVPEGALLDPAQERARKDRALAIAAEIRNDITRGRVVSIDIVLGANTAQQIRIKNKMLGIPTKVAPRAAALRSAEAVRALVEGEVIVALEELIALDGHVSLEEARETFRKMFGVEAFA